MIPPPRATRQELVDILRNIVANSRLTPDPAMNGETDCYTVPCDDIAAALALFGEVQ